MNVSHLPISHVHWTPCYRIVPGRYPSIHLLERVADPEEWDALDEIEALTNERILDEVGVLSIVAPEERVSGDGANWIMGAFTHPNPDGSRFCDGTYGAYHAAIDFDTAVAESRYHRGRFMSFTAEPPAHLEMRVLVAELDGELVDLRGLKEQMPAVYDTDDYGVGQLLGRSLRKKDASGIVYESVRHRNGQCVAVLRPPVLSNCRHLKHLVYIWDGARITRVTEDVSS